MSVYASTPGFVDQQPHPRTLFLIIAGHVALIAVVMAAKMDLPARILNRPIVVQLIPEPTPPDPEPQPPHDPTTKAQPTTPKTEVKIAATQHQTIDTTPSNDPFPFPLGNGADPVGPGPTIAADPVRTGPRFATPASELQPPYPESKRRLEEEATLKLRLAIDPAGRVTSVDPVGTADRTFLDAARRHILAHWRYKPATQDGRAIASSTVITLRFELDD